MFFQWGGAALSFNITSEAMISNGARYCQMVDLNALHMSAAKIKNSLPARPWPWATGAGKTCMILQLVLFQISWMDKDAGMNYKHALDSRLMLLALLQEIYEIFLTYVQGVHVGWQTRGKRLSLFESWRTTICFWLSLLFLSLVLIL